MGKEHELLAALRGGNVDQARKIMAKLKKAGTKKKVNVNVQDETGFSSLHHCAANGYADLVKEIVDYGGVVMLGDNKGMSPLHIAAFGGQYEAALVLLMRHADPNAASRTGDTPLHLAAQYGHTSLVETLLDNRANCNLLNVSGQTPLDLACQHGHKDVVHLLLKSGQCQPRPGALQTPLHIAAKHGQVDCLRLLIQFGYAADTKGMSGTCLHEASLYGKVDVVRFLLEAGADVAALNGQGLTPLEVVNQYTDPRSSQELKKLLQEATYMAQRRLYYSQQQQQLQPQHVQASPQQQAFYNQQQFNLLQQPAPQQQQPVPHAVPHNQQQFNLLKQHQQQQQQQHQQAVPHSGHVVSQAGYTQAPLQRQQPPLSYANVSMASDGIDGQFVSRDRSPTVDSAMMGMRRGQRVAGIGGNPDLAAQIASLASRRNSQKDSTPPTTGVEEFPPYQRTQRSYTVSAPQRISGHYQGPHSPVNIGPPSFKPVPPPGEREREPDSAYSTLAKDSPLIHEVREGLRMSRHSMSPDPDNPPSDFAAMLQQGRGTLKRAGSVQEQINYPGMDLAGVGSLGGMVAAGRTALKHAQTEPHESPPVGQQSANQTPFTAMIQQSKGTLKRSRTYQEKPKQEEPDVSNELMAKLLRRQQKVVEGEKGTASTEEGMSEGPAKDEASEPIPVAAMARRNSKSQTPPPVAAKTVVQPQPAASQQAQPPPSRTEASIFANTQAAKKPPPAPPPRSTPLLNDRIEVTEHNEFQQVVLRPAKNPQVGGDSPNLSTSGSDASLPHLPSSPATDKKVPPPVASKQMTERQPTMQEANPAIGPQSAGSSRTNSSIFDMTQRIRRPSDTVPPGSATLDETALFSQARLRKVSDSTQPAQPSAQDQEHHVGAPAPPPPAAVEQRMDPAAQRLSGMQEADVPSREAVSVFAQARRSSVTKEPSPPMPRAGTESGPPARGQLSMFAAAKQDNQGLRTVPIPTQKNRLPRQRTPPEIAAPPMESNPPPAVVDPHPAVAAPPPAVLAPPPEVEAPPPVVAAPPPDVAARPPPVATRPPATASQPPPAAAPPPNEAALPPAVAAQPPIISALPPAVTVPPPAAVAPPPAVTVPPPAVAAPPPAVAVPPPAAVAPPPAAVAPPPAVTAPPPAAVAPPPASEPVQPVTMAPAREVSPSVVTAPPTDKPPTPISEWLAGIKLGDYVELLQSAGYDTTDFLIGITADDLIHLGMSKIGHRKRLLAALQSLPAEDRQPKYKPVHVSAWLNKIGLQQYESVLVEAGYDEIEYVTDIAAEELSEVGVTKQGHVRKFVKSLAVLEKLPEAPSRASPPAPSAPPTSNVPQTVPAPAVPTTQPPPPPKEDSPVPQGLDKVLRMTGMSQTSSSSSLDRDEAYGSEDSVARSVSSNEQTEVGAAARKKLPPLAPARNPATALTGQPSSEGGEGDEFTMTDITGVLDSALGELGTKEQGQGEGGTTDALMCELDDMLANLSTQLDIIIPQQQQK